MDVDNYEDFLGGGEYGAVVLVLIPDVLKDCSAFRLRQSKNSDLILKLKTLRLSETSVTANRTIQRSPKRRYRYPPTQ